MSQKVLKWTRDGAILIGDYSDYYVIGLFYTNISFSFHLHRVRYSVVFFASSETSLHWSHRLLAGYMQCEVRLILQSALICTAYSKVSRRLLCLHKCFDIRRGANI